MTPTHKAIRIHDLAQPELPEELTDYMQQTAAVTFSREELLATAMEQTGLSDFGSDDFFTHLDVYLQALNEDQDLSPFGRQTAFNILLRYASERLRFECFWRQHPEIAEERIERPIIIAGLPRSGTTHLLNLISADQTLRALPYWESLEPVPRAGEPEDARRQRCHDALLMQDQVMPLFKNMHEMSADHTHEEIELAGLAFSSMLFENYALAPRWRDHYLQTDQTFAYAYVKRVLQMLQWLKGPKRWVLKSPAHMEQYPVLSRIYPDATFVLTHRDPLPMVASLVTMLSYSARLSRAPVRPQAIANYWFDRVEIMLQACVKDSPFLPKERTVNLMFEDFMADDIAAVRHIYQVADHPFTADTQKWMQAYMEEHPRGKFGRIAYDLAGQFGADIQQLRDRYSFYIRHFDVATEQI